MFLSRADMLAIVAVVDIAIHGRDGPVRGRDIEQRHGLSKRHLEKTLQGLGGDRILTGERGKLGGYRLARAPHRITLQDILQAMRATPDDAMDRARSSIIDDIVIPTLHRVEEALSGSLQSITIHDLALGLLDHSNETRRRKG